jgi:hypothetical protein
VLGARRKVEQADGLLDQQGLQGLQVQATGIHGYGEEAGPGGPEGLRHPEHARVLHGHGVARREEHPGDEVEGAHEAAGEEEIACLHGEPPHVAEHLAQGVAQVQQAPRIPARLEQALGVELEHPAVGAVDGFGGGEPQVCGVGDELEGFEGRRAGLKEGLAPGRGALPRGRVLGGDAGRHFQHEGQLPGHEGAAVRSHLDPTLGLQFLVGGQGGVAVDAQQLGQRPGPREGIPGLETPVPDALLEGLHQLEVQGFGIGSVERDGKIPATQNGTPWFGSESGRVQVPSSVPGNQ